MQNTSTIVVVEAHCHSLHKDIGREVDSRLTNNGEIKRNRLRKGMPTKVEYFLNIIS